MTSRIAAACLTEKPPIVPLPEFDPELNRIFSLVMGQEQNPPCLIGEYSFEEIDSLDKQERKTMLIFEKLRSYEELQKGRATIGMVLYEAIKKNDTDIVRPLMTQVSPYEFGRAFTAACAHNRLEIFHMMLEDGRISPEHLGEGFRLACDFGRPEIAAELKHHPKIPQSYFDEGYRVAFQENHNAIREAVSDKASSVGIGAVFITACKSGRIKIAARLLNDSRLKMADLIKGLHEAEKNGFDLRSDLSTKTRIQLFFYQQKSKVVFGGLVFAAFAGSALFQNATVPYPSSLKMVNNLDSFFAVGQRCCQVIKH